MPKKHFEYVCDIRYVVKIKHEQHESLKSLRAKKSKPSLTRFQPFAIARRQVSASLPKVIQLRNLSNPSLNFKLCPFIYQVAF